MNRPTAFDIDRVVTAYQQAAGQRPTVLLAHPSVGPLPVPPRHRDIAVHYREAVSPEHMLVGDESLLQEDDDE